MKKKPSDQTPKPEIYQLFDWQEEGCNKVMSLLETSFRVLEQDTLSHILVFNSPRTAGMFSQHFMKALYFSTFRTVPCQHTTHGVIWRPRRNGPYVRLSYLWLSTFASHQLAGCQVNEVYIDHFCFEDRGVSKQLDEFIKELRPRLKARPNA